jgi:fibronectin type 3 domain-containing protein
VLEELEPRLLPDANVLTYHNDNASTGQYLNETLLTPANVGPSTFGKLFAIHVDGQVYAQPLYMSGVNITTGANQGLHNVVFVATEHDSLYAIDADNGSVLWQDSFLSGPYLPVGATVTPVPGGDTNSTDLVPEIGITSTPVIDPATNTLFLTAKTKEVYDGHTHYVYRLHGVDVTSGVEVPGAPVVIADTVSDDLAHYTYVSGPFVNGSGDGRVDNATTFDGGHTAVDGTVVFNTLRELQRPALTLANGSVYLAFASHGDNGPYHGWVLGYSASDLWPTAVFNTTPNGGLGGIWQAGGRVAADDQGNLYFQTGNGTFDGSTDGSGHATGLDGNGFPVAGDYGDSFVKLAVDPSTTADNQNVNGWGLKVVDYFTPFNQQNLDSNDIDLGSGGPLLLPDAVGAGGTQQLLVGAGKEGRIYLIDRNHMGHFDPSTDHVVQELPSAVNGDFDTPAYFNGTIYYVGGFGDVAKTWSVANGLLSPHATSTSSDFYNFPGSTPAISANGTHNGMVWDLERGTNQLRAYDAAGYGKELYTSAQAADDRDRLGSVVKFSVPLVAHGKVYVGTADSLVFYGLFSDPTSPPPPPSGITATAISSSAVYLSWQDNSATETGFKIERSTDGVNFTLVGQVGTNMTGYGDGGLTPGTAYYYRVRATNALGDSAPTDPAKVTTQLVVSGSWVGADIGGPSPAGSFSLAGGTFTVTGGGSDIWNRADAFHYVYQALSGDGAILARVASVQDVDPWTKAAVMVRGSVDANAAFADVVVTPSQGTAFQARTAAGDPAEGTTGPAGAAPYWLDVVRTGDTLTGYTSTDGVRFTQVGSYTIPMPGTVYIGLAVTSHHDGTPATAVFDQVTVSQPLPSPPAAPSDLTAAGISSWQASLSWTDNADDETAFRVERSIDGANFTEVGQVGTDVTSFTDSGLAPNTEYFYRVRATNGAGDSDASNTAAATTLVAVNGSWADADIGGPSPAGSFGLAGGTFTVTGGGSDIWNQADSFHYVYQALSSDGTILAQVASVQDIDPWTKAGVMVRGSLAPGAAFADMVITPGNGAALQARTAAGAEAVSSPATGPAVAAPYWVELVRAGNLVTGLISADGVAFTPVGSFTVSLPDTVYVGLALTSHQDGTAATATFDNVAVSAVNTVLPDQPSDLQATATAGTQVNLSWRESPSGQTGFQIERSPDGARFSLIATALASATGYLDTGLNPGTQYFYRVRATNTAGASDYSDPADVTTRPSAPADVSITVGDNALTLSWTSPTGATSYNVYRSTTSGGEGPTPVAAAVSTTAFTDTGVTNGTTYFYQVSAVGAGGEGARSEEASAAPLDAALSVVGVNPPATDPGVAFSGVVATFADADPRATADDFTAAISWGDQGTGEAADGILDNHDGTFSVTGHHTYAAAGSFPFQVTFTDVGGNSISGSGTAVIGQGPTASLAGPQDGVRGQPRVFTLGADDPSPVDQAAGFVFDVQWGDGDRQTVTGPSGTAVSHAYTATGSYTATVTATNEDGAVSAPITQTVTIQAVELETDPFDGTKLALAAGGTLGDDQITFQPADPRGGINVIINGVLQGTFRPTSQYPIAHLFAYGQDGNDIIRLAARRIGSRIVFLTVPALLFGGDGNDTLTAGGSTATNVLEGGSGNDTLVGGSGRDLLIGGPGADLIRGNNSGDIFIGGTTDFDANLAALNALMAEWGSRDLYPTRVNFLSGSGGTSGRTGSFFLNATTVHDDGGADTLVGGSGRDWFFAHLGGLSGDAVRNRALHEAITSLP